MRLLPLIVLSVILIIFLGWQNLTQGRESTLNSREELEAIFGDLSNSDLLLPDLAVLIPDELYMESLPQARYIRFSTTFINMGQGPLEVVGIHDEQNLKTKATQEIYTKYGDKVILEIGEFVFHPGHEHWHIENYVEFQMWSYEDAEAKDLVVTTDKMSFCIWDESPFDLELENAISERHYVGCGQRVQGISVGWSDTYQAGLDGQLLDITDTEDGVYLLRTLINPDGKIIESNYTNNSFDVVVSIAGDDLQILNN